MKIEPKMLSFANVLVLRWKICDTCEKSLWMQRGREEPLPSLKRGETVAPRRNSSQVKRFTRARSVAVYKEAISHGIRRRELLAREQRKREMF
jgi:hypothetical protein